MSEAAAVEAPAFCPISREVALATEQFIRNVTVPIFSGEKADGLVGTGALFSIADRYFVVTAAHVFEDVEGQIRPNRSQQDRAERRKEAAKRETYPRPLFLP